ncbi:MAG TPA: hypothetical protein VFO89_11850 [Thermoanaerobaculia bacterium]|nr:hypothetical protein [Thermoanaerobaculia bacterium]
MSRLLWPALVLLAALSAAALLHSGQPLGWDELEYFRATKWVSQGEIPFRDFWEHHTPLQWLVFAPAAFFVDSPGASAIVAMRWVQAIFWIAAFAMLFAIGRLAGIAAWARWAALAMLLAAPSFVRFAVEYRVDALGSFLFVAAVALALRGPRWVSFGALMSCAVLANMRLAPLVIVAAIVFFLGDRKAWRMAGGVAVVVAAFVVWLALTGAWPAFVDGVVHYNAESAKLLEVDTFFVTLLAPVWSRDVAAITLWLAAIAGAILGWRVPVLRSLAILFAASVGTIALMEVQYEYHFQTTYLLMLPLAAHAFERLAATRGFWREVVAGVAAVGIVLALVPLLAPAFGNEMRYQDAVMREVDRRTRPDEKVWDGSGYALRRAPAYRYWFLATGVRMMAATGKLPAYDIAKAPPAAILYNLRLQRWFELFPDAARYATHHYVPLYRDLWLPGLSGVVPPGRRAAWIVPRDGRYRLIASPALPRHPWFTNPLQYASIQGSLATRYAIPLARLPRADAASITWTLDNQPISAETVDLKKGSRLEVRNAAEMPLGILVIPEDLTVLCVGPAEEFQF